MWNCFRMTICRVTLAMGGCRGVCGMVWLWLGCECVTARTFRLLRDRSYETKTSHAPRGLRPGALSCLRDLCGAAQVLCVVPVRVNAFGDERAEPVNAHGQSVVPQYP